MQVGSVNSNACMQVSTTSPPSAARADTPLPQPNSIITPQIFVTQKLQKANKIGDRTDSNIIIRTHALHTCTCYVGLN